MDSTNTPNHSLSSSTSNFTLSETERTDFFDKVTNGNITEVIELITQGVNPVTTKDQYGFNALMLAAYASDIHMVKALMPYYLNGEDFNVSNRDGYTALMLAAECGFTDIVKALLSSFNKERLKELLDTNKGDRAVRLAAMNGFIEIVKLLIPYIQKDTLRIDDNFSPAIIKNGLVEVFDILFSYYEESAPKMTPLLSAVVAKNLEKIKELVAVTDPKVLNEEIYEGHTLFTMTLKKGDSEAALALIPYLDITGLKKTPSTVNNFFLAARHCSAEVLKALSPHFTADEKNAKDDNGYDILMDAANSTKYPEVIDFLINELGSATLKNINSHELNALMLVCRHNPNPTVIQCLVDHYLKIDPDALHMRWLGSDNLLALAIHGNTPTILPYLIERLGTEALENVRGTNNALEYALLNNKVEMVKVLKPHFVNEISKLKDLTDPKNLLKLNYEKGNEALFMLLNTIKPEDRSAIENDPDLNESVSLYKQELNDNIKSQRKSVFSCLNQIQQTKAFFPGTGTKELVASMLYPKWYLASDTILADETAATNQVFKIYAARAEKARKALEAPQAEQDLEQAQVQVQEQRLEQQPAPVVFNTKTKRVKRPRVEVVRQNPERSTRFKGSYKQ